MQQQTSKETIARARRLRRMMTAPEAKLWQQLRTRPGGVKFRRQHPIGAYVLDFYVASAKLAIEIDGAVHDMGNMPTRDAAREAWLAGQGVAVVRLPAREVMEDVEAVVERLVRFVSGRRSPLHHSLRESAGSSSPPDWTWIAGGNPTLHSPSPSLRDREDY
ncbi:MULTISPECIES: endonuclease domain-containing protein [unclassified Sphingopyxis]|uniref:endonuclease domain-containing protein n=1 Tax=unclassified Sphingopyxis TaxID=2614943 RepID=UPI0009E93F6B|nr:MULTISPECIES: endonuclease domain-containing protein [unclassified Sphingopyxis]